MTREELAALHTAQADDPHAFWLEQARRLDWDKFPTRTGDWSFAADDFHINWYEDGVLNLSVNCLDRHLPDRAGDMALVFDPPQA